MQIIIIIMTMMLLVVMVMVMVVTVKIMMIIIIIIIIIIITIIVIVVKTTFIQNYINNTFRATLQRTTATVTRKKYECTKRLDKLLDGPAELNKWCFFILMKLLFPFS